MDKRTQKKEIVKEVFWFLLKFNLLLIPFYAVIYFDIDFYLLQEWFAGFIGFVLKSFGYFTVVDSFFIYVGEFVIDISRDCLGWKSAYSLFALVLASPGKLKDKWKFLGAWVPLFFIFNAFRVLITVVAGLEFGVNYLDFFHRILWQEVMIATIIGVWWLWLRRVKFQYEITITKRKDADWIMKTSKEFVRRLERMVNETKKEIGMFKK